MFQNLFVVRSNGSCCVWDEDCRGAVVQHGLRDGKLRNSASAVKLPHGTDSKVQRRSGALVCGAFMRSRNVFDRFGGVLVAC